LLPPTDQAAWTQTMIELLNNPAQRGRMVAAGFLQAREFTWKKAAQELLEIYQGLV
jgi:glycosyltransferase involved in cell wall biosynthesis